MIEILPEAGTVKSVLEDAAASDPVAVVVISADATDKLRVDWSGVDNKEAVFLLEVAKSILINSACRSLG